MINRRITAWYATMAEFSARLREIRETRGIKRKDLAKHLGVAPGTIWNWENSYSYPKPESIAQLASFFGVNEEFLRKGQNSNASRFNDNGTTTDDDAEPFPAIIEEFRRKVALVTGMPPSHVRISVEFLST
jgi:transcriptional regulator with XRE-family HTH domain